MNEISHESRRQFQMYEKSCLESGPKFGFDIDPTGPIRNGMVESLGDPFDDFFNAAWTYDQEFMYGRPFSIFDAT